MSLKSYSLAAVALAGSIGMAACGGDDSSGTSTNTATTSAHTTNTSHASSNTSGAATHASSSSATTANTATSGSTEGSTSASSESGSSEGDGGGTGDAGTGDGGDAGELLVDYTFDTSAQGFILNTFAQASPFNLGQADSGTTPTVTFDSSDGNPNPGSLMVTADYSGPNQYVDAIINLTQPGINLTGKTLHAMVRVVCGPWQGYVMMHASTGSNFSFIGGTQVASTTLTPGTWVPLSLDLSSMPAVDGGYNPAQLVQIGIQFTSSSTYLADGGDAASHLPPPDASDDASASDDATTSDATTSDATTSDATTDDATTGSDATVSDASESDASESDAGSGGDAGPCGAGETIFEIDTITD